MASGEGSVPVSIEAVFGGEEKWPLSEEAANEIVLKAHPDLEAALATGQLPDEIPGPNGVPINPRLHLTMHILVERQLAADRPEGISKLAEKLEEKKIPNHQIRHLIGEVFAAQLYAALKDNRQIDTEAYLKELEEAIEQA